MNRAKKEEMRKRLAMGEAAYEELVKKEKKLRELHADLFPEEYDFMYDSISDARARSRGENPMAQEYIDKVNARRREMMVEPYGVTDSSPEADRIALTDSQFISSREYCEKVVQSGF